MFIYSQHPLSTQEAKAKQLYITCFEEDLPLAQPVFDALDERGTTYISAIRSHRLCTRSQYVKSAIDSIGSCRVAVVMLSKATFSEKNRDLQQLLWYEVGCMAGNKVKIALFFLDIPKEERNRFLTTTPVRQKQGTDSIPELIELLDSLQVEEKLFYDDPVVNRYASQRISYVKLTSVFYIYKSDLDAIYDYVSQVDEEVDSKDELLDGLLSELRCGCTVMSFNTRSRLGPEVEPYYPEVDSIVRDYPIKQNYIRPILLNNNSSPDIYATIRAEFILPIHSLLGVTFKPFLAINRVSRFRQEHIRRIIRSNAASAEEADIFGCKTDKEQRVYFLFEVDTLPSGERFDRYGSMLNHLWPQ